MIILWITKSGQQPGKRVAFSYWMMTEMDWLQFHLEFF